MELLVSLFNRFMGRIQKQTLTSGFIVLIIIVSIFPTKGEGWHYEEESNNSVVGLNGKRSPPPPPPPPPPSQEEFRFELGDYAYDETAGTEWATRYVNFIQGIRQGITPEVFYQDIRLLPAERAGAPNHWIDIVLVAAADDGGQTVTLRLRGDNVYLVGFRPGDSGRWYEFTDDNRRPQQLITGSTSLGFGGSYSELQENANRNLRAVRVGYGPLLDAIRALNEDPTDQTTEARAEALQVAVLMFSESNRFTSVMNFVREMTIQNSYSGYSDPLGEPLSLLTRCWGWLSGIIGRMLSDNSDLSAALPSNNAGIETLGQAVDEVPLMLRCGFSPLSPPSSSLASSFFSEEDDVQCPAGEAFLEVVLVRIQEIKGRTQGRIYGTVSVSNSLTSNRLIYDRSAGASEKIEPNNESLRNIRLSDPNCLCIPAADSFAIRVNLLEYLTDTFTSRGIVSWNAFDVTNRYNMRLSQSVGGAAGSAVVEYIVYGNAFQAALEIKLLSSSYERRVFGTIAVSNVKYGVQYDLFKYSRLEPVSIASQQKFPLLRRAIAVPIDSSFTLDGKLSEYDILSRPQSFADIDGLEFAAKINGTTEKRVKVAAGGGELQILVKWNDMYCKNYGLINNI